MAKKTTQMISTPKGIMYLISRDELFVCCYDDQTGKNEKFLISEIVIFNSQ
jgi:hypothetical protein